MNNEIKKLAKPFYFSILIISSLTLILALTMTGDSIEVIKGAQGIPYPIYLNNNESVVGFQVEINYSTSYLTLTDVEATSRLPDATIVYNDNYSPLIKIAVLINNASNKILPGEDAILNLIFNVDESAVPGDYPLNLSNIIISNITATSLPTEAISGILTIVEPYNITFLPPISTEENFTLQDGATLPFKFEVRNETDFVVDNSVKVRIFNESLGIDKTYNTSGEGDGYIKINETEEHYIVNIHTNQLGMPLGNYDIDVSFNNFQKKSIGFELIQASKGKGKKK
jgi:hypothetical protein